jgi:hypothetical protein
MIQGALMRKREARFKRSNISPREESENGGKRICSRERQETAKDKTLKWRAFAEKL